jgi:hypothetical protein
MRNSEANVNCRMIRTQVTFDLVRQHAVRSLVQPACGSLLAQPEVAVSAQQRKLMK